MAGFGNALNLGFPLATSLGGTGLNNSTATANGILIAEGASSFTPIVLSAGELLIGTTSGDPAAALLSGINGIGISSLSGQITITNTYGLNGWVTTNQTSSSASLIAMHQYINTGTSNSKITYTMQSTVALGYLFRIVGVPGNTGGWTINFQSGQTCHIGSQTTSSGGSISSNDYRDVITIVCTATNTKFSVLSGISQNYAWT